ncbi:MAG: hypothetical protein WCC69_03095, partial [Pirellulales bacterium]
GERQQQGDEGKPRQGSGGRAGESTNHGEFSGGGTVAIASRALKIGRGCCAGLLRAVFFVSGQVPGRTF